MFCPSCGRSQEHSCIHTTNVTSKEQIFLIALIIALPSIVVNVLVHITGGFHNFTYMHVGVYSITIILLILSFNTFVLGKLHLAYFFGCHQKVSRSFKLSNKPFIICARCTGLFVGLILSNLLLLFSFSYYWLLLLSIPMIVDGVIQHKTDYISNNLKRFVTGVMAAPTIAIVFGLSHYYFAKIVFDITLKIV